MVSYSPASDSEITEKEDIPKIEHDSQHTQCPQGTLQIRKFATSYQKNKPGQPQPNIYYLPSLYLYFKEKEFLSFYIKTEQTTHLLDSEFPKAGKLSPKESGT